jgi:hypothetical protein
MVLSALNIIISRFFASITASVGNLGAEKDLNLLKSTFNKVFFLNFWMYAFSTVCCVCLFQNFIGIWVGEGMLLDVSVLIVILINFYLNGMRKTVLTFKDALGLYWYDRFKPIVESVINLGVSILLAVKIGFIGIFIGTMISCITTSLWIEPYVLCKYGFKNEGLTICSYFMHFIKYTLLLLVDLIVCLCIVKYIHIGGIWGFAVRTVSVVVLSNIVLVAFLFKSDNFKWFKELLISLIKKHLV